MKKIRLLALLMLCFVAQVAMGQNIRVGGQVTGSEDGLPIPGATVIVKGTTTAAGTDIDGNFSLQVPSNATLEVRYVGMKTAQVAVNGRTTVNIALKSDALQASEVTVTAMGIRKQNRALGYATTTVKGDDISSTNTLSPINALQGKVAGVNIAAGAGGVTGSSSITIRGAKSLSKNNSPIFVIDGIVLQNTEQELGKVDSNADAVYGNQLKNLNPDDYESVVVLKGAAATSLYGSRGANGAIVITTKRGKDRKGLGVEASYTHEFKDMYASPFKLQNEYGMGSPGNGYEGDYNPGWESSSEGFTANSYGPKMDGTPMKQYYKGTSVGAEPFVAQPDNWKQFFQTGSYDNVSVAILGGNEHVNFRLSYGYTDATGTMVNNNFNRHSVNFTSTGKINDIFSVDANIQYTNSKTTNPQYSTPWDWGLSPTMLTGYYMPRNMDLGWVKDNYYNKETYELNDLPGISNELRKPFVDERDKVEQRNEQTIIARVQLNAQISEKVNANVAVSFNDFKFFFDEKVYGDSKYREGGKYGTAAGASGQFNGLASVNYSDSFLDDRFTMSLRAMGETYGDTRSSYQWKETNGGLLVPGVFNFGNSKNPLTAGNMTADYTPRKNMTVGVAAIAEFSWVNQVFLEVTARNDWVSSLLYPTWLGRGANNYSVFYPSVNASWVFSDTFNIDPSIISFGKLRASYAEVGSGTSAYQTADGAGGYKQEAVAGPGGEDVITGWPNIGIAPNFDLKPELQKSFEVGADVRFLNDRLGFDFAWYRTNTVNQIIKVAAAPETGVSQQLINAGSIINKGWEFQIDATPIQTADFRWNVSGNISRNRGYVAELAPGVDRIKFFSKWGMPSIEAYEGGDFGVITAGGSSTAGAATAYQTDPNKAHYGKKLLYYAGSTGKPNATPVYSPMKTTQVDNYYTDHTTGEKLDQDYSILGNIQPDFLWGFNTSLAYKGFNLFVQIDGRQGGSVLSEVLGYVQGTGATESSLAGRDAEHGGLARQNYKDETVYNGVILDGVFGTHANNEKIISFTTGKEVDITGKTMQQAVDAGDIQPMLASLHHNQNGGTAYAENAVYDLDYVALRNITLSYDFPTKWIQKIKLQSLRLSASINNVCYIYNGLPSGYNPESISNNNPLSPIDYSGVPFTRNYSLSVNLKF